MAGKLISATKLSAGEQAHIETPQGYINISVVENGEIVVRVSDGNTFVCALLDRIIESLTITI